MELTGRLTADAKVSRLKDDRKVVNFSIAINDSYKSKDSELRKVTTYVNCSYWINPGIADYLQKGTLVEMFGRISANAWTNSGGEPNASLNFHVNSIKLHGKSNATSKEAIPMPAEITQPAEDLPF